jgi:DegV family protein with EDD domain
MVAIPVFPSSLPQRSWQPGGPALKRALLAGIRRVLARRDVLNRMNVFPVPDGDTGSNLAFTLAHVEQVVLPLRHYGAGALLRRAGDEAIDGARGNSGAILAQFLQGLGERLASLRRLGVADLAQAVQHAAAQARAAVAEPREGTMLSVIAAFADALCIHASAGDLRASYEHALAAARTALARTPEQLAVLRRAGVVDAGGQGFVDLLEGIADYIRRGRPALFRGDDYSSGEDGVVGAMDHDASTHRYCTECVLNAVSIDRGAVRLALAQLDHSSLVLAGTHEKLRVHVHLDEPQRLYDTLATFGTVGACKADDMRAQQRTAQSHLRTAVVVDSAADLTPAALEHLHLVPVRLNFGARDYLDKVSMSSAEFFRELRSNPVLPRTSQPPPGDFRRLFDFLLSHHEEVVYVGLSRAVSGTLQAGESAAARSGGVRVRVIDSRNASCGQGLLAERAAELAGEGLDGATIAQRIEGLVPRTLTFAYVRDVAHAVRGGRIPAWALPITRWLKLVPVARVGRDGKLHVARVMRGRADLPERFARWLISTLPAGTRWRILIGHADAVDDGERLCRALQLALADSPPPQLVAAGAAICAHAGPGALVVSLMPDA